MTVGVAPALRASDTRTSLLVLAGVILFACAGLALDGNWPKLLRVSSAFVSYAGVLTALGARRRTELSLVHFVAAGIVAGFVSGIVRPDLDGALVVVSIVGGAAFGAAHWLGLTKWRALASAIRQD